MLSSPAVTQISQARCVSAIERTLEKGLEEELAKIDPEILQYLLDQLVTENVPAV